MATTESGVRLYIVRQVAESEMGKVLLKHFANRKVDSNVTKLDTAVRIAKEYDPTASHKRVRHVFMGLEKAGAGRYIIGRLGYPTRFVWNTSSVTLAKAVMPKRGRPKTKAA